MSKIIKSSRIIENQVTKTKKIETENTNHKVNEHYIQEAKKQYSRIIKEAEEEANNIIGKAEDLGESIINDAYNRAKDILSESKASGNKEGYEIGHSEGYRNGYDEGKAISDKLISESLEIKDEYILTRNNLLKELEEDIIHLVINIYEKVINEKTESDNEMIISLVLNGISNLDFTEELTIITSKEDFNILEMSRDEILARASMISTLKIRYDNSFEKGDCVLETPKGSIDIGIKNQLDEIKQLLTTILNNE